MPKSGWRRRNCRRTGRSRSRPRNSASRSCARPWRGQERLALDTRELDREGPSFTLDTLADMRREIGPQRPLVLLLGADAFAGLPSMAPLARFLRAGAPRGADAAGAHAIVAG